MERGGTSGEGRAEGRGRLGAGGARSGPGGRAGAGVYPVLAPGRGGRSGGPLDRPVLRPSGGALAGAVGAGGLLARREAARPFSPWYGELTGETVLLEGGVLSLRFQGREVRGDGRPARVRWGDVWALREGAPRPLGALFPGEKGWRGRLWRALVRQGEELRRSGGCFLDGDWARKAKGARPLRGWCLTGEGIEVSLPQCAAAPAAEGCPTFTLPLEKEGASGPR